MVTAPFTRAQLIQEQQRDPNLKPLFQAAEETCPTQFIVKNGIIYAINLEPGPLEQPSKIVVPTKLRQHVLEARHACSGHFGAKKTRANIQQHLIGKKLARMSQPTANPARCAVLIMHTGRTTSPCNQSPWFIPLGLNLQ